MHDIKFIREFNGDFDIALKRRGFEPLSTQILDLDEKHRQNLTQLQVLQARKNAVAQAIGKASQRGGDKSNLLETYRQEATQIKIKITELEIIIEKLKEELNNFLVGLPNILLDEVPEGLDESANVILRQIGVPRNFIFTPKPHYELGEALGEMDFDQAGVVTGSRFVFLKGDLAKLERAISQFMIDLHTTEFGYELVSPPLLVNNFSMFGTGQLPKFAQDAFHTTDDKWLIPTSEVPLTCFVANKILDSKTLPLRMTAHTPCFRLEAGSAGRDTRGMLRQHQFYKVELVSITTPNESLKEHDRMVNAAEEVLRRLELPYRVMYLSSGDTGFNAQRTYDLEVWLPGQMAYREISSCSVCGDFQARRMNAKYRKGDEKPEFVHTLNGSGLAVGRTLIAIMENYQQEDGSIKIPQVLIPYMQGQTIIK